MRISPGAIAAGSALTVATVLAGCGGSQAPAADITAIDRPSVTTSSAAAPSSSATEAVSLDSDAAVEAAARAYVAALLTSVRSATFAPFERATTADCLCREGVRDLVSGLQAKHIHEDVKYTQNSIVLQGRKATSADVIATLAAGPYHDLDVIGKIVKTRPGFAHSFDLSLRKEADAWRVYAVRQVS